MLKTPMAAKVYVISLVFFLVLRMSTTVISCKPAGALCFLGQDSTCCGYPKAGCLNYQIVWGQCIRW